MEFRERLVRGLVSSVAVRAVSISTQLLTIPILTRAWGAHIYGEYLILIAVSSYAGFATLGMHQPTLSEMSIARSKGDHATYANTLAGLFQWISAVSILVVCIYLLIAYSWTSNPLLNKLSGHSYSVPLAIFLIGLQQILLQNFGVATTGLGALGRYSEAQAFETVRTAVDAAALWLGVLGLGFKPDRVAALSVMVTLVAIAAAWLRLRGLSRVPLFVRVRWAEFRALGRPAMGNFVLTVVYQSLILHGPRLLLGSLAGAASVALFSIVWALIGTIRQIFDVVVSPLTIEFAYTFGGQQQKRAARMLAMGSTAAIAMALAAFLPVAALGPWIIRVATGGRIEAPASLVLLLWAAMAVYGAAICFQTALVASNRAYLATQKLIGIGLLSICASAGLTWLWGPYGMGFGLLGFQALFAAVMISTVCRLYGLRFVDVLAEARSPEAWTNVAHFVRDTVLRRVPR